MKDVILSVLIFIALLFFFTPFVAPHLYRSDMDFVTIFTWLWALSNILWDQHYETKKTLLIWTVLCILLIAVCFIRDRIVYTFGYKHWYHTIDFYIYIGIPTSIYWAVLRILKENQQKKRQNNFEDSRVTSEFRY